MVGRVLVWLQFCLLSPCLFAPEVVFSHQGGDKRRANHLTNVCVVETTHPRTADRRSDSLFGIVLVCWFYFDFLVFVHLQSVLQEYDQEGSQCCQLEENGH